MSLNKKELEIFNKLIKKLDDTQKSDLVKQLSINKNTNVNFYTIEECPHCHSKHIVKFGKYKNTQKYVCKDCHKHFRETENTILKKTRKDIDIWEKYIQCMVDKKSLRETAKVCEISLLTSFEWRHKILDILSNMMNKVKLSGIIESDETYTRVSYKGNHTKSKDFILPREAHKRGGDTHTRGLSREQVCISCIIDLENTSYSKVSNLGAPKWNNIYNVINNHIDKSAVLVTDSYKGYDKVVEKIGINHIPIPEGSYKNGTFNIQKMNSYHSYLKDLINHTFRGVSTKYLNNYLVYHSILNTSRSSLDKKIVDLREYIFKTKCNDLIKGNNRPAIPA